MSPHGWTGHGAQKAAGLADLADARDPGPICSLGTWAAVPQTEGGVVCDTRLRAEFGKLHLANRSVCRPWLPSGALRSCSDTAGTGSTTVALVLGTNMVAPGTVGVGAQKATGLLFASRKAAAWFSLAGIRRR